MNIKQDIRSIASRAFELVGFCEASRPPSVNIYADWIRRGENGSMKYLERHLPFKTDPQKLLKNAKSWIVVAHYYDTAEPLSMEIADQLKEKKQGWVSRYARGTDYHEVIQGKLRTLIQALKKTFPGEEFLDCVDFRAVLERDAAARAGLGWIGKNTCLINAELGSFLFLGEILTTLEIPPDKAVLDHCGTCTRCLDACPTGAIVGPRHVDATKCISYWTIEEDSEPPTELAAKFGVNIFGCDICQDVCPWNQKSRRKNKLPAADNNAVRNLDLREFVSLSVEQIEEKIKDTALERAGGQHLLNNARRALNNLS